MTKTDNEERYKVMAETKLIELGVRNIKRIELAHFFIKDGVTEITGKNAQGKSSLIDSCIYLLAGNRGVGETLIRGDEDNGTIEGTLLTEDGPVHIRKVVRRGRPVKMTIRSSDGSELPAKWLSQRVPAGMVIDVDKFMSMSSRDQVSALAAAAGIEDRLVELNAELAESIERRKYEKKQLALLEAKNANFIPHRNVPDGEFKVGELVEMINAAEQHNRRIELLQSVIESNRAQHEAAKAKIAEIEAWMVKNDEVHAEKLKELEELGGPEDVTDLQKTLDNAEDLQKKALENQQYQERRKEIVAQTQLVDECEDDVKRLDEEKADTIAKADLGVPGLSFTDEGVTLNGHPFDQASQAEQRLALSALTMNPAAELKLVLVKDASLWDGETRQKFYELCEARGYNALIETVIPSSDDAIEVVDGRLKDEEAAAA